MRKQIKEPEKTEAEIEDEKVKLKEEEPKEEEEVEKEGEEWTEEDEESFKKLYRKRRKCKKAVDLDEEEPKDGETLEKEEENPEQAAERAETITDKPVIGQNQNVFVPQTQVEGAREATGKEPGQESYSGKSKQVDLRKSPLFLELNSKISQLDGSVKKRLDAIEKSVKDRVEDINKTTEKLEKFYKQPFYKAISENVAPEATLKKSIGEQVKDGSIRYKE